MSVNGLFLFYWKHTISTYGLPQNSAQKNWLRFCTVEEKKNADDLLCKTLERHIKICLWCWKWIYTEEDKLKVSFVNDETALDDLQW